jgi:predicted  nucleic acid-binding Zn-ribbon protein
LADQLLDTETTDKKDVRHLEESLQILWDKVRHVSDVLLRLKVENKELQSQISSLELKERRSKEEIQRREHDLDEIRTQLAQAQSNGNSLFSKEESEVLKSRLKELIMKINSRI